MQHFLSSTTITLKWRLETHISPSTICPKPTTQKLQQVTQNLKRFLKFVKKKSEERNGENESTINLPHWWAHHLLLYNFIELNPWTIILGGINFNSKQQSYHDNSDHCRIEIMIYFMHVMNMVRMVVSVQNTFIYIKKTLCVSCLSKM